MVDTLSEDALGATLKGPDRSSRPLQGTFAIRVVGGPDKGKSLVLDDASPSRVLVGRSPSCELRLSDSSVSRRHLAFELVDGRVLVSDVESTNGARVDAVTIGQAWLSGGETIQMGNSVLATELRARSMLPGLVEATRFGRVLGQSREMRRLYPFFEKVASSRLPVLVEGETGTGKELLAEALHEQGPRAAGPFVVFSCATVPPNLVELVLFGQEAGAAVGTLGEHRGVFEEAHGGTLLIDEVGDLDTQVQGKLLRVVERGELRRLGGTRNILVDVRIIATTQRDLDKDVHAGRFRDDLFHRLTAARVELPPLRKRVGDVPLLVAAFAAQLGQDGSAITAGALARWEKHAWPGNVRELRNAVARELEVGEMPAWDDSVRDLDVSGGTAPAPAVVDAVERVLALDLPMAAARQQLLEEFERRYLERVLAAHGGNVTRAAETSGVARRHFHRLLARMRGSRADRQG